MPTATDTPTTKAPVRYYVNGKRRGDTLNKFGNIAYFNTKGIDGKDRITTKELKALLASLGVEDHQAFPWEVTLPNGVVLAAKADDDASAATAPATPAPAKPAKPATAKPSGSKVNGSARKAAVKAANPRKSTAKKATAKAARTAPAAKKAARSKEQVQPRPKGQRRPTRAN